ncbi:MAG TPA: hypothetical protein VGM27_24170 [Acidobacteriaceae bacterium]
MECDHSIVNPAFQFRSGTSRELAVVAKQDGGPYVLEAFVVCVVMFGSFAKMGFAEFY